MNAAVALLIVAAVAGLSAAFFLVGLAVGQRLERGARPALPTAAARRAALPPPRPSPAPRAADPPPPASPSAGELRVNRFGELEVIP